MEPGLRDGDWLMVDPDAQSALGDLCVADDGERLILKRVIDIDEGGRVLLGSDNPAHAGQRVGPLEPTQVVGRAWFRYWPLTRLGRIR